MDREHLELMRAPVMRAAEQLEQHLEQLRAQHELGQDQLISLKAQAQTYTLLIDETYREETEAENERQRIQAEAN